MTSIVVAMPAQGSVKSKTSLCLGELCLRHGNNIAELWTLDGTYLHRSREKLLKAAADSAATHLMFIDSDVIFPPDGVERLRVQNRAVVGATYNLKWQGKRIAAHKPLGTPYGPSREEREAETPDVPFEVQAVPTGFMLIDLSVIRQIPRPWFDFGPNTEDEWVGEDVFFCEKVRSHGHDVWCDPRIKVGHLGDWIY